MSGWIWLLLIVFMIVILISGAVYVLFRALAAGRTATRLASVVENKLSETQSNEQPEETHPPLFTQPLRVASEHYAKAHADVIARHNRIHERHMATWQQWKHFNE